MRKIVIHLSGLVPFLLAALFCMDGITASAADFTDLNEVLRTFADSRLTRDVKYNSTAAEQKTFMDTLDMNVYRPADQKVVRHVESLPEYQGKRVITHDFRTPGTQGVSVNTDRDVRVLVEVEPNRWVEVPTRKWEKVYYREFANRTGYAGDPADAAALRDHASKFRQMPTDRFHVEASHDYTDQTRTLTYEPDGRGGFKRRMAADSNIRVMDGWPGRIRIESTPNVVRVKAGKGLLLNPESMSQMYFQKGWAELSAAQAIENQLRSTSLSPAERLRLDDLRRMHTAEGLAQMKKGVETLETVRSSYQKQGYHVGDLPKNFQQASEIVKAVNGTSRTDVDGVIRNLQEHGFRSPIEFADNLKGQTESLKWAKKSGPPPRPSTRLQNAGRIAGWAGDVLSIDQRLEEARQGSHLIWNFDKKDSALTTAMKTAMIAATELIPIPVIDALERGWRVDEQAKAYVEDMVKRGETDWKTHPSFVMFAVVSTVTAETVASMTLDPLAAGGQALVEGGKMVRDVTNNFLAEFSHAEQQRLLAEMKHGSHARAQQFDLGGLFGRRGGFDSGPLAGEVEVGETIAFVVQKNDRWTDAYSVRWEMTMPGGQTSVMNYGQGADDPEANRIRFTVSEGFPPGPHTVTIRIFERGTYAQVDYREATFTVSGRIGIGAITACKDHFLDQGGVPLFSAGGARQAVPVRPGDVLAFDVSRIGNWTEKHEVQWLVDGRNYKTVTGIDPKAHLLRFDSTGMKTGAYPVAVRLIDTGGSTRKIVAHQSLEIRLGALASKLDPFTIRAALTDYAGPPLPATVQNGDILAFQADIKHPEGEPQPAQIFWQVYDAAGKPVKELGKQEQIYESGGTKNHRFKFQLEDLADGEYVVGLTHLFSADPNIRTQAASRFRLSQSVRIDRVLVTDNPEDQTHKPLLSPDQEPLFYAHYSLGQGVKKATVTLAAKEAGGRVIETHSVERPRPGETAPYRVGLAVPNSKVPISAEIRFEASIVTDDGKQHTAHTTFRKEPYRLVLSLPETLNSGENRPFSITAPKSFKAPFKVDVHAGGRGLSVGHTPGSLQGTVGGIAMESVEMGDLRVAVTDAEGRTASAQAKVLILPAEKIAAAPSPAAPPGPAAQLYVPQTPAPAPAYTPPNHSGIEKGPARPRPSSPTGADYEKIGRERWERIAKDILNKTIHSCYRTASPQAYEKARQILLKSSVNYSELARMDTYRLAGFTTEQEKKVAATVYNSLMQANAGGDCAEKMISELSSYGLISRAQVSAFKEKNKPKTIYWAVVSTTLVKRGNDFFESCRGRIVTGNRPPATGLSQPNPAAAGHYLASVKAYGTLDQREAQRIVDNINRGGNCGGTRFATTTRDSGGITGARLRDVPLVTYGPGVEGLLGR
ncbi:MAG: hypothetical protein CVU57_20660 [Deltaproteobacteria bacterium HGW-Deltaproteobacteria-15]|nr:MAG: hypothetical protein CVU57_20660 [Deltaproteobacteria bacterium HGW-Deltaproteobacteria-15]